MKLAHTSIMKLPPQTQLSAQSTNLLHLPSKIGGIAFTDDFDPTVSISDLRVEDSVLPADPSPCMEETTPSASSPPTMVAVPLGQGHCTKTPSVWLRDFFAATTIPSSPSVQSPPLTKSLGVSYPIHDFVNCDSFSNHHQSFLAFLHTKQEPLVLCSSGPRRPVA